MSGRPAVRVLAALALAASSAAAGEVSTPETSGLFRTFRDPVSGVESRILTPGLVGHNQQSLYFVAKSMTDDGRFLVFDVSDREDFAAERKDDGLMFDTRLRRKAVVDFEKDEAFLLEGFPGLIPFLDRKTDSLYYADYEAVHRRDLKDDPQRDVVVCAIPSDLRSAYPDSEQRIVTHLTLTADRTRAFLDVRDDSGFSRPGLLDFRTGRFTPWAHLRFFCNHGQVSQVSDDLALCAHEMQWLKTFDELTPDERAAAHPAQPILAPCVSDVRRPSDAPNPRVRLLRSDGICRTIHSKFGGASHETFTPDGKGVIFCARDGVVLYDLATERQEVIAPVRAAHADLSPDGRFVAYDSVAGMSSWRGCAWRVGLYDRKERKNVWLWSDRPAYAPQANPSRLHPDPHPHFVCGGRYVVSTMAGAPGRMDLCVTPVISAFAAVQKPLQPRTSGLPIPVRTSWSPQTLGSVSRASARSASVGMVSDIVPSLYLP